ncbi:hypothetical protein AAEU32_14120 [Pseudoalteromonas sp. SSDWG2]|uniref:hypothetical protein n=1 Tax=Pseudoalteromonas sp. SSDWG2 TaxID=3139391 RepID=UPI003BA98974
MRIYRSFHKAPVRVIKISRRRQKLKLRRAMVSLKWALAQEREETKEMLDIYRRYTKRQASKQELQVANEQFVDLLKGLGLGVFAVLPFAPITIPLVVKIAKIVGVDILPSSFSNPRPPKHSHKDKNAD